MASRSLQMLSLLLATSGLALAGQTPLQQRSSLERNATIALYPESLGPSHIDSPPPLCSPKESSTTITLGLETCLSGAYYARNAFQITEDPVCPNGGRPIMVYYQNRGCTGQPTYHSDRKGDAIPHDCLWKEAPYYWSIIFRCSPWATLIQGADAYVTAIPPESLEPRIKKSKEITPANGLIRHYFTPACTDRTWGQQGIEPPRTLPIDRCLTTPGYGIELVSPGYCANGTRAQWARFKGPKCNRGEVMSSDGLLDVPDSDIGNKCLSLGQVGTVEGKVGSMAFWCDGLRDVENPRADVEEL